jgi:hypothetical protein
MLERAPPSPENKDALHVPITSRAVEGVVVPIPTNGAINHDESQPIFIRSRYCPAAWKLLNMKKF